MAVIRVNKNKNYTVMSNHHLTNKALTLKAKGLLSVMLALPENWNYTITGLVSICKENETAVNSALNELKSAGYVIVTKLKPNQTKSGRFEYIYDIFEHPQEQDKQGVEKQGVENQGVENQGQLNTNNQYTEKLNKQEGNGPTLEEVKEWAKSWGRVEIAQKFFDYYSSNHWIDRNGVNIIGFWKQKFLTWCNTEERTVFVAAQGQDVIHSRKYSEEDMRGLISDIETIEI